MRDFPDITTLPAEAREILSAAFEKEHLKDPESPETLTVGFAVIALSSHGTDEVVFREYHFDALASIGSNLDHARFSLIAGLQAVAWRALAKTAGADANKCQIEEAMAIKHHRKLRDLACQKKSNTWLQ